MENLLKNGIKLSVSIEFIETGNEMKVLSFTVSNGSKSIDYSLCCGETTIAEMLKDFMEEN